MGCGCRRAAVRFLESRNGFRGVDLLFLRLVELLHQIPFCASFGVSCAGHFEEWDGTDKNNPNDFYPEPWGHLNISVVSSEPHIQELLELLRTTIGKHADASFKKISHGFGPPETSVVEIWEIRIGDNGALKPLGERYFGGNLKKEENPEVYLAAKQRHAEIAEFWMCLQRAIKEFCQTHEFAGAAIDKRVREIVDRWNTSKPDVTAA